MNILFFGNGNFGIETIKLLNKSKHKINAIITDSNKKSGRGLKKNISNIVSCAESLNIKLLQHDNISDPLFIDKIQDYYPDLFIVIDYKIIPQSLLNIPKIGSINLHASYLPDYKGASPIQRALMNNDDFLGITTFFINSRIDEGNIILQEKVKINETITYSEAYNSLSFSGSKLMIDTVNHIYKNKFKTILQTNSTKKCIYKDTFSKFARKIHKDEYKINFNTTSYELHNKIRALTMPGCYAYLKSKRIKLFNTYYSNNNINNLKIGEFAINKDKQLLIGCKSGILIVNKVQIEGKNIINAINFYNNNKNNNNFI